MIAASEALTKPSSLISPFNVVSWAVPGSVTVGVSVCVVVVSVHDVVDSDVICVVVSVCVVVDSVVDSVVVVSVHDVVVSGSGLLGGGATVAETMGIFCRVG